MHLQILPDAGNGGTCAVRPVRQPQPRHLLLRHSQRVKVQEVSEVHKMAGMQLLAPRRLDELTLSVVGEVKPSRRAALSWSRSKQPCINRHRADIVPCM